MSGGSERERLGQRVREVWIAWAREQPNPKASWLVPWSALSEPDKEVDRRIGEAVHRDALAHVADCLEALQRVATKTEKGFTFCAYCNYVEEAGHREDCPVGRALKGHA